MATIFTVTRGLPYARRFRVVDGKNIWANLADFEVRSQLREKSSQDSDIIANLHDFMTKSYGVDTEANDIIVDLALTGEDSDTITKSGYFDVILSDPGAEDVRAVQIGPCQMNVKTVTTKREGTT